MNFEDEAADIYNECRTILYKKQADYGPKSVSQAPGGALNGVLVRMHDKWQRIQHLVETGATPENESLIDSFQDLLNYCVIALMVLDNTWPGTEKNNLNV